jgi:hypothetical protein
MSGFDLRVLVSTTVVLALVKALDIQVSAAEDFAAMAFVQLWEKNPKVEQSVIALLYAQSVFLFRDEMRAKQRISKRIGEFLADQLNEMLRQDVRENPDDKEAVLHRAETAVADAKRTESDLDKAFLEVLLTEEDVIGAKTKWHVKIGQVHAALTSRGFDVTRRDVDNIRERFQRNPDFRMVISYMRGEHAQPARRTPVVRR